MPRPWQGANSPTRRQAARAVAGWRWGRTREGGEGGGGRRARRGARRWWSEHKSRDSETNGMTRRSRDTVDALRAQSRSPSLVLSPRRHPHAHYGLPAPPLARLAHAHPLWTDSPGNMLPVLFVLTRRRSTRRRHFTQAHIDSGLGRAYQAEPDKKSRIRKVNMGDIQVIQNAP